MKSLLKVTPLKLSMLLAVGAALIVFFQDQRNWQDWLPYRIELKVLDFKFSFRDAVPMEPQVVIAAGDEKALREFGVWGSWKRSVFASMMRNLFAAEADVVAFDMVWSDEQRASDPLKFRRIGEGFEKSGLVQAGEEAQKRAAAARARLAGLDKALKAAEKGSRGRKPLASAVAEMRKAREQGMADLAEAEKAAASLSDAAQGYRDLLAKEAESTSDDELVEVLSEFSTKVVQGFIAEPAQTESTPDPEAMDESFARIAPSAMDQLYLGLRTENASPAARVARTLEEMCAGKPAPCAVNGEELAPRVGLDLDELVAGVRDLEATGAAARTDEGVRVDDLSKLKGVRTVGDKTVMVEWQPDAPDAREKTQEFGAIIVRGNLIAPLPKFAEVGQNFGFYAATADVDGVFRSQPLVFRYFPHKPHEDAAACTACNRQMLTPDRFAALEDAGKCSPPCLEGGCKECLIHAYYLPSLAMSLVQQRFGLTPVLLRSLDYDFRAIKEAALLPMEPVPHHPDGKRDVKGPRHVVTDSLGRLMLNYYGSWRLPDGRTRFPMVSVADIVNNTFDKNLVKGKAIIFAVTALGTYDQRSTPFDPFVPGVVIHATAAQNMLDESFLQRPPLVVLGEMIFLLVMGLLLGLLLPRLSVPAGFVAFLVLFGAYWAVDVYAFFNRGLWVHLVWPYLQLVGTLVIIQAHGYLTVGREKAAMRKAFSACLDPLLVEELAADPETLTRLQGDERDATCMFSDIRGFTTLSENLTPQELTVFLNDYFTRQAAAIMHHRGYLDKYIGDAIMALYGAPKAFPTHAVDACLAAVEMMDELKKFKKWVVSDPKWSAFCQRLLSKNMDPASFDIGIGVNTGLMRVGYMGSAQRTNYSALGDAVNLSSRLEGQTKEYGVHIILGESTMAAAAGKVSARLLDSIRVKGKKEPVKIYELISVGDPTPEWAKFIKTFETGIELYLARRFEEAVPYFAQALREKPLDADYEEELKKKGKPRDLISAEYIVRCQDYLKTPPPPDWDGVVTKTTK